MEITIERDYDYIPKWQDNDKSASPIVFHMQHLSTIERDKLIDYTVGADGNVQMKTDRPGMFLRAVKKIDNLMVNGERISTAKDFLDRPGLNGLLAEIIGNIISTDGRTDLKNS